MPTPRERARHRATSTLGHGVDSLKGKYVLDDITRGRLFVIDTDGLVPGNLAPDSTSSFDGKECELLYVAGFENTCHGGMRADLRLRIDADGEIHLLTKGDGWTGKPVALAN